ncbi:hypothetical protein JCM4814A_78820 [Streptomyces phaeofaciens JCM 4814]|uniref:Uncharacterized protein n=1 Tax=Streptomyces phaeofaciens TaxID=68254 RepID=A0A918HRT8_9ACTN|nr:hypothetical protein [Streptomyces phaeofaciens]GGT96141.1 hypothetical protein GCM10010226_87190 [Streptomyces phaeofaciens]
MKAAEAWLHTAVPVLLTLLLARAVWALAAVEVCARWLWTSGHRVPAEPAQAPWMVVLLPMLREQAIAQQTMAAFTALDYPCGRAAVVVITTERETSARTRHRSRLADLVTESPLAAGQLRGLFPAARCDEVADTVNTAPPADRLWVLTELFNAEPTTAEVVSAIAAQRLGRLPPVHLHQPDVGGRKAGQLNFALDHFPTILGPLGWSEDEHGHDTYAVVYDADAVPDRRTLQAFAAAATTHRAHTGTTPALIQQQRLPLLARRPFPTGPVGLLLAGEWVYQLRRSLGIELARIRLHRFLATSRLPEAVRMWLRPMVYAVGCGMAVHLPAVRALAGFPEPMEDLGTGHRLSLLGADLTASTVAVLDEPYTEPSGLTNLHALAFTASARPDRHAAAVAHLPAAISCPAKAVLVAREWADEAVWLIGAPLIGAAVVSAWWAGPAWTAVAAAGVLLHGPVITTRLLAWASVLHSAVAPPPCLGPLPRTEPHHPAALIAASPLQPFIRLVGPWRLIGAKATGRHRSFGKTER